MYRRSSRGATINKIYTFGLSGKPNIFLICLETKRNKQFALGNEIANQKPVHWFWNYMYGEVNILCYILKNFILVSRKQLTGFSGYTRACRPCEMHADECILAFTNWWHCSSIRSVQVHIFVFLRCITYMNAIEFCNNIFPFCQIYC